ncbi:MAG: orotate phosphoribosyltransferase [Planctomycetes bacterium]|nr:orotate phosphoribosyltransferase [Planctomycetota bacterium]
MDDRDRLLSMLVAASRRGEFVLSSGKKSDFYIDGKQVTLTGEGLSLSARLLYPRIVAAGAGAVGGPSTGADPIVGALGVHSWREGSPLALFYVRKEPKGHGAGRRIEGPPLAATARVALVEDVVTTGASLVRAIDAVRSTYGSIVVRTFCLVDREEGGGDALAAAGVPLEAIFRRAEILARL